MALLLGKALIVCFTLLLTNAEEAKPPSYKVVEHKTLLVPCNITKQDDIEIYWTKNQTGSHFYQAGSNLMFTDIVRNDSGDYICHAFNTSLPGDNETNENVTVEVVNVDVLSIRNMNTPFPEENETNKNITVALVKVDVLYPAEIVEFSLWPDVITDNETFAVSVNVKGNPGPTWEIRNNNTGAAIVQVTNMAASATLSENYVRCGDTGFYECTGYNKLNHGVNVTRGKTLTVLCSPRQRPGTQYTQIIYSRVGNSAVFAIEVVGYPFPRYHWSRDDGRPMPASIQTDNTTYATLNITNIKPEDFTTYTLTVSNSMGTYFAHYELKAHGSPERPYNLTFKDVTYNSVALSWKSGFDMGSEEHFVVLKLTGNQFIQISDLIQGTYYNHGIGQDWTYTQNGLDSETDYNLTVVAVNADGFMSAFADHQVSFRTKTNPNPDPNSDRVSVAERNIKILVGSLIGGLVFIGFLAFIVYLLKYRKMRTSYEVIKGKTKA